MIFKLSILVLLLSVSLSAADEGTWIEEDHFAQVNLACIRVYNCTAPSLIFSSNKKLVLTSPKVRIGVCIAGGGPADSCNHCFTSPPVQKCEYHLENK